eukprot:301343-Chlamydomonas_euryale.AAC.2
MARPSLTYSTYMGQARMADDGGGRPSSYLHMTSCQVAHQRLVGNQRLMATYGHPEAVCSRKEMASKSLRPCGQWLHVHASRMVYWMRPGCARCSLSRPRASLPIHAR